MSTPKLAITTAVLEQSNGGHGDLICRCHDSWMATSSYTHYTHESVTRWNTPDDNLGVTGSLQWLYEHTTAPIIAYLHSDTEIFEQGWDARVLKEFDDPSVGVVGFGGSIQHGEDDIYKLPYKLTQLRRIGYMSNTTDAEIHGDRFVGSREVAVLDGFALIMRRSLLDRVGGWPVQRYPFHCYDYWACVMAHKLDCSVRLVGIDCIHHGGATSTSPEGQAHWQSQGTTDAEIHEQSHRNLYEDGRGILPWRVR